MVARVESLAYSLIAPLELDPEHKTVYEFCRQENLHNLAQLLANKICESGWEPQVLVYPLYGGRKIELLAEILGLPCFPIARASHYDEKDRPRNGVVYKRMMEEIPLKGKIVGAGDDIIDGGETMEIFSKDTLSRGAIDVKTLVYHQKAKPERVISADFVGRVVSPNTWVVYEDELKTGKFAQSRIRRWAELGKSLTDSIKILGNLGVMEEEIIPALTKEFIGELLSSFGGGFLASFKEFQKQRMG